VKAVYKFIAGNSRITPAGVVLALAAGVLLRGFPWAPIVYASILIATLWASTFEPVA